MKHVKLTFLCIFVAIAAGLLLFGPRASTQTPPGRVVVTYWEKWTGKEGEQLQQIVDDFNNTVGQQKGIYVQCVSMSNINQKVLVAAAAGDPPDVAGIWDRQIAQYASLDALEPLDQLAAAHGITKEQYKPVYWNGCTYEGKLWGLISTPWCVALHYNKRAFEENADLLRKAGCDPTRSPRTIAEFDRYAAALDIIAPDGRIERAGYMPLEPDWYLQHTSFWFGASVFDEQRQKFVLTDPRVVAGFNWVRGYALRLGASEMSKFKNSLSAFDSPQNAFFIGRVMMVQQGPWLANFIENRAPAMNRWKMTKEDERKLPTLRQRQENYEWAAAPFPSAVEGLDDVTYAGFDALVLPRGARHVTEAFEFIAYVNSQPAMEKLCSLHCKNSPLIKVSEAFLRNHPNPYIDVFERLSASPNARPIPSVPIWMEVEDEMRQVAQKVYLLQQTPEAALAEAQERLQNKLERFQARATERRREGL